MRHPVPTSSEPRIRAFASGWTVVGVAAVFAWAVYRLGGRGLTTIQGGLAGIEWSVLIALTAAFVYGEGFRTLDRRWVPELVTRALRLREERNVLFFVLAPLYGLRLVGSDRAELLRGWLGTGAIVVAVVIVRSFPAPWRGIVDFAVASALAWGLVAILRRVPAAVS